MATVYYIDYTNGNDTQDGLTIASDHALATIKKFTDLWSDGATTRPIGG